jgi:hypothetical protein
VGIGQSRKRCEREKHEVETVDRDSKPSIGFDLTVQKHPIFGILAESSRRQNVATSLFILDFA